MKPKKRKKFTRMRGSHTHGRGAKKKARGKGHRGGIGKAGTGKRGDQKKTLITKIYGNKYFGKDKVRRALKKPQIKTITLRGIIDNIGSLIKKDLAKKSGDSYELDLKAYKIIGDDHVDLKLKIDARAASKGAQEAVKKAGGEIVIETKDIKIEVKLEKKEGKERKEADEEKDKI